MYSYRSQNNEIQRVKHICSNNLTNLDKHSGNNQNNLCVCQLMATLETVYKTIDF